MIQRIQSIFLLLAAAALFGLFGLPFASSKASAAGLMADGLFNIQDHVGLIAAFVLGGVLAFVSIFLFKNRKLQAQLGMFAFIATIIGMILAAVFFMQDSVNMASVEPTDEPGLYLPILSAVLLLLAVRFIRKDEKTVKSMDRLR